jgi:hypothetical protein
MHSKTFFLKWQPPILTINCFLLNFLMNFGSLTNFLSQKLTKLQQFKIIMVK